MSSNNYGTHHRASRGSVFRTDSLSPPRPVRPPATTNNPVFLRIIYIKKVFLKRVKVYRHRVCRSPCSWKCGVFFISIEFTPCFVFPQLFHFSLKPHLPSDGHFKGRVKWLGNPSRNDATIQLLNATLNDNGTYRCAVHNPPDVFGAPTDTVLTVTPKSEAIIINKRIVLMNYIVCHCYFLL